MVNLIFVSKKFGANSIEMLYNGLVPYMQDLGIKFEVSHLPHERYNSLKVIWKNIKYIRTLKGDVFHITGNAHFFILFLPKKKSVLTILDLVMLEHYPRGLKSFLYKLFWIKLPIIHARKVICISVKTRDEIIALYPQYEKKIEVISCSYSKRFKFHDYRFHQDNPIVLIVGTAWNKNLMRIIEAVDGIKCRLDIIGKLGKDEIVLLEKEHIEYRNYIGLTDDEMVERYVESDMLCFPSVYEGFGVPIIEAQAVGRPVITSRISPLSDVAGNGAILVNPESISEIREAIEKIILDNQLRLELIRLGKKNVSKYAPEKIAAQYVEVYQAIKNGN